MDEPAKPDKFFLLQKLLGAQAHKAEIGDEPLLIDGFGPFQQRQPNGPPWCTLAFDRGRIMVHWNTVMSVEHKRYEPGDEMHAVEFYCQLRER